MEDLSKALDEAFNNLYENSNEEEDIKKEEIFKSLDKLVDMKGKKQRTTYIKLIKLFIEQLIAKEVKVTTDSFKTEFKKIKILEEENKELNRRLDLIDKEITNTINTNN